MRARGCYGGVVWVGALWFAGLSIASTNDLRMNGIDFNPAPGVVALWVIALLLGLGAYALMGWRSITGIVLSAVLVLILGFRMYTLAPMLPCWSYDKVGYGEQPGTYHCFNIGSVLP